MHKLFIAIHFFVARYKTLSIGIALLFLGVFGYAASRISFEEDITKLLPQSEKNSITAKVVSQLNFADKITVIISRAKNGTTNDLTNTATVLLDSLKNYSNYIAGIQGRAGEENIQEAFDFVYNNLPLFLDGNDYKAIAQKLQNDSIAATVHENYKSVIAPSGLVTGDFIARDPFGISFIALKKLQQLGMGTDFILQDGFLVTKNNQHLLLFINPELTGSRAQENAVFADKLNGLKNRLNTSNAGKAEINYFGAPLIAAANARQIKTDIQTTAIVAVSVLMLIFVVYYRRLYIPLIIFLPTVFGVVFAIALLYFLKNTISAISLSIGAILVGVTIDYALHILTHYKHNSNVTELYRDITRPLIMSSTTTAVAFLCLLFVKSEALIDLGIFAAVSVVATAVFSLLIIPHLYRPEESRDTGGKNIIDRAAGISFDSSRVLLWGSLVVIIASFFTFTKVGFNDDLSQLNFIPDDIKKGEKILESATTLADKSLYIAAYAKTADEALNKNSRLYSRLMQDKQNKKLVTFSSVGDFVLSKQQQQQKIAAWNSFWAPAVKQRVKAGLLANGKKLGFSNTAYMPFYTLLDKKFMPISLQDYLDLKIVPLQEFITHKNGLYTVSTLVKVKEGSQDSFAASLNSRPGLVVIDRQRLNETFLGSLAADFNTLINYSFIAVIGILFVFFKRIELVIISCIPIAITGIVTAGVMAMLNIELNIFSSIVCTLIFGHGVDFSIFMTSALQKEYTYGRNEMKTYRTSILLAVITTILGIGALVFARHPALLSIASAALIGVFAALVITFIFYPILFRFLLTNRVSNGKAPLELAWPFSRKDILRSQILSSYVYKENEIVKEVKGSINDKIAVVPEINGYINNTATVLCISSDYGETALITAIQNPGTKVYSYITNADKRDVAGAGYLSKRSHITYIDSLDETKSIHFDIVLISDTSVQIPDTVLQGGGIIIALGKLTKMPKYQHYQIAYKQPDFTVLQKQ